MFAIGGLLASLFSAIFELLSGQFTQFLSGLATTWSA